VATNWTFQSGASTQSIPQTTAAVTSAPTPHTGDLMICAWGADRATTAFTSATIADTGSGGWTSISPGFQNRSTRSSQAWWKVATSSDFNGGSGITITVTGSGGSSTIAAVIECDVFRLPTGYSVVGIDIAGGATPTSATTASWHPGSGSTSATFTDALAYSNATSGTNSRGVVTGTNTFTGTSTAAALTQCFTQGSAADFICGQYVGGVQASSTAASNTWVNTWTNSVGPNVIGATFTYQAAITAPGSVGSGIGVQATPTVAVAPLGNEMPGAGGFEDGTLDGWAANLNCTVANSTAQAHSGTHSLAATSSGTGPTQTYLSTWQTYLSSLTLNQSVIFSAWLYCATSVTAELDLDAFSSTPTYLSTPYTQSITIPAATWTQIIVTGPMTSALVSAGATYLVPIVQFTATSTGQVVYVDDASYSVGAQNTGVGVNPTVTTFVGINVSPAPSAGSGGGVFAIPQIGAVSNTATASGVGVYATPQVTVGPASAPAAGVGVKPTVTAAAGTNVAPGAAPASGVGVTPTVAVGVTAVTAVGSGLGVKPTVAAGAGGSPTAAPGTGVGFTPTVSILTGASTATGVGAGVGPTVQTGTVVLIPGTYGYGPYGAGYYGGALPIVLDTAYISDDPIGEYVDIFDGLALFITPQVRDRPPYLPNSSASQVGLMRHYENRLRGVIVWQRNDGSFAVDTPCNYESAQTQPAAYISDDPIGPDLTAEMPGLTNSNAAYPWNPFPGSTNSNIPGSYAYNVNFDQTTQDFILDPYNINWWQGGAENIVTQDQALVLTAAGFGDCIGPAPDGASLGSNPDGQGPYGSGAINA
jgi:hypothetical protein